MKGAAGLAQDQMTSDKRLFKHAGRNLVLDLTIAPTERMQLSIKMHKDKVNVHVLKSRSSGRGG
jgi:hypothetical protein